MYYGKNCRDRMYAPRRAVNVSDFLTILRLTNYLKLREINWFEGELQNDTGIFIHVNVVWTIVDF